MSAGTSQYCPKFSKTRNTRTGSKLPAVEVPDPGASYNPTLEDHQDLLWKGSPGHKVGEIFLIKI